MSETIDRVRAEELKLLRGASEGTLPKDIAQYSADFSYDALAALCVAGFMNAERHGRIVNPCFHSMKITSIGIDKLAELEQLAVPDHTSKPPEAPGNNKNEWYEKPLGLILIAVVSGLMLLCVVYLLKNHLGLPL